MFKKAYTYMFGDNKIVQKMLSVGAILLIFVIIFYYLPPANKSVFAGLLLIGVLSCIMNGYFFNCIKSIAVQNDNIIVLPYCNPVKSLITGLKAHIGIGALLLAMMASISIFAIKPLSPLLMIFSCVLCVVFFIYLPAFMYIFSRTENILSFFKFPTAGKIVQHNTGKYLLASLILYANCFILDMLYKLNLIGIITSKIAARVPHAVTNCAEALFIILAAIYVIYINSYIVGKLISAEEFEKITAKGAEPNTEGTTTTSDISSL